MGNHLTDYEVFLLASDPTSRATRMALAEHLGNCDTCREKVAQCVLELARDALQHELGGVDEPGTDGKRRSKAIVNAVAEAHPNMASDECGPVIIRLFPEGDIERYSDYPLAAHAPDSPAKPLPVLHSADGKLRVRFRDPGDDQPIRAYVIGDLPGTGARICLVFPDCPLSFNVGRDGEADLPGVAADDLRKGRIQIELHTEEAEPET